jgi:hypothetical protein
MSHKKAANNSKEAAKNLVERETSEADVTVAGLTETPPTLSLVFEGRDDSRVRRSFVQQVPMRDAGLASRALSELHPGDRVQVTVVNEWRETGCDTYLTGFSKGTQEGLAAKNGANGVVHSEIRQVVVQPEQAREVTTRKQK